MDPWFKARREFAPDGSICVLIHVPACKLCLVVVITAFSPLRHDFRGVILFNLLESLDMQKHRVHLLFDPSDNQLRRLAKAAPFFVLRFRMGQESV